MNTKWLKRFGFYSMVGLVAACASAGDPQPPQQTTTMRIGNTRAIEVTTDAGLGQTTYYASSERVFAAVDEAYGRLEIPLTIRNPRTSQIGNGGLEVNRIEDKRMSTYFDCGQDRNGRLANTHAITLTVVTALRSVENDGVEISTVVSGFGEPRATSGNAIPCNSTGALERRIAQLAGAALISDS